MTYDYYVYAHVDESEQFPFYIGVGKERRAYSSERNDYWLAYVGKFCPSYRVEMVAGGLTQEEAWTIENALIKKIGKALEGNGPLLNITDGGFNEGVFVALLPDRSGDDLTARLTEFGQKLFESEFTGKYPRNISIFLKEIMAETIEYRKQYIIKDLQKPQNPRKPWIVPFSVPELPKKNDQCKIHSIHMDTIIENLQRPVDLEKLPVRTAYDSLPGRISMYFDKIIEDAVFITCNGTTISRYEPQWYFNAEFLHGYAKIIHLVNKGKSLQVKHLGRNKRMHKDLNIHDFEVSVSS